MAGSLAPVMYWAVRTALSSTLWSDVEQLPYLAIPGGDATVHTKSKSRRLKYRVEGKLNISLCRKNVSKQNLTHTCLKPLLNPYKTLLLEGLVVRHAELEG